MNSSKDRFGTNVCLKESETEIIEMMEIGDMYRSFISTLDLSFIKA